MLLCSWCENIVVVSCKLKQKRQQHSDEATAEPDKLTECRRSKDPVSDVSATTSFRLTESHKRKRNSDDAGPGKKLKFSSLFTNNPEIPHIDRYSFFMYCCYY